MDSEKNSKTLTARVAELEAWVSGFVFLTIIIPLLIIAILPDDQRTAGLAELGVIPFIEYLAITIGVAGGINPVLAFLLTVLPCTGVAMLITGIIGFLGDSSPKATRFIGKVQKKIEKYPRFNKYGVTGNFFFIIVLGMYITPGVSILLGWPRVRSMLFMFAGICFITFIIGLASVGIIELFFVD